MNRRVGILTWHYHHNFGSMLQAYALQRAIEKLGFSSCVIDYYDSALSEPPTAVTYAKYLIKKAMDICGLKRLLPDYYSFQRFYYSRMKRSRRVTDREGLKRLARDCDCVVFGSDQIWAPNVFDPVYMGDFMSELPVKRISYAASIGLNDIPAHLRPEYKRLLAGFSRISLREEEGKNLLMACCGLEAEVVVDPTLLLCADEYRKMERQVQNVCQPYIFCYFLHADHAYRQRVEEYAKKAGLKIYGVSACAEDAGWMERLQAIGPEEFLWLVDHAQKVFTDSYHGTLFSLQFGKDFRTFERFSSDDPICQNSRIRQLAAMYGIGDWILAPEAPISEGQHAEPALIQKKMEAARQQSLEYLRKELQ